MHVYHIFIVKKFEGLARSEGFVSLSCICARRYFLDQQPPPTPPGLRRVQPTDDRKNREILRTADPFLQMKKEEPDRYLRLEHWLQKGATIDPRDLYPAGSSKEKRRAEIANMLIPEVGSWKDGIKIADKYAKWDV